jgi:hypothetical protein
VNGDLRLRDLVILFCGHCSISCWLLTVQGG